MPDVYGDARSFISLNSDNVNSQGAGLSKKLGPPWGPRSESVHSASVCMSQGNCFWKGWTKERRWGRNCNTATTAGVPTVPSFPYVFLLIPLEAAQETGYTISLEKHRHRPCAFSQMLCARITRTEYTYIHTQLGKLFRASPRRRWRANIAILQNVLQYGRWRH